MQNSSKLVEKKESYEYLKSSNKAVMDSAFIKSAYKQKASSLLQINAIYFPDNCTGFLCHVATKEIFSSSVDIQNVGSHVDKPGNTITFIFWNGL